MIIVVNTISLVFYFYFLYYLYKKYDNLISFPLYFVFSQTWIIISSYYLDFGEIYTYELDLFSKSSLATSFLILINTVFLFVYFKWFTLRQKNLKVNSAPYSSLTYSIIDVFIFFYILMLYFSFRIVGYIPLLSGIDRATYSIAISENPLFNQLSAYFLPLCFLISTLFALRIKENKKKMVNFVQIILVLFYLILASNKFSRIIQMVFFGIIPYFLINQSKIKLSKLFRISLIGATIFSLIILIQSEIFGYFSAIGGGSIMDYLVTRIFVLQGQIWWKSFNIVISENAFIYNHLRIEILALLSQRTGYEYVGLNYLMEICTQGKFIYNIIENGNYKYTGAFPAILLVSFNYTYIFPVVILLSIIYAELSFWLNQALHNRNLAFIFFSFLLFMNFTVMLLTGNFKQFFSLFSLIEIFILLFLRIVTISNNRKTINLGNVSN